MKLDRFHWRRRLCFAEAGEEVWRGKKGIRGGGEQEGKRGTGETRGTGVGGLGGDGEAPVLSGSCLCLSVCLFSHSRNQFAIRTVTVEQREKEACQVGHTQREMERDKTGTGVGGKRSCVSVCVWRVRACAREGLDRGWQGLVWR